MPVTEFTWNPLSDSVLEETDGGGNVLTTYQSKPQPFGALVSQSRGFLDGYFHFDAIGSTRLLTDDSQNVSDDYVHDSFGIEKQHLGTTPNNYTWVGRLGYQYDPATNDYYIRMRSYQPYLGQWLSTDPLWSLAGGMYTYANNHPTITVDPSGLQPPTNTVEPAGGVEFLPRRSKLCPDRQSVITDISPKGGSTLGLKLNIHLVRETQEDKQQVWLGRCGAHEWRINWLKTNPAPQPDGSFILQHITKSFEIFDCDGKDITVAALQRIPNMILGNINNGKTADFWEAWWIPPGKKSTQNFAYPSDDSYQTIEMPPCTRGTIRVRGRYTEVLGKVPDSMKPGTVPFAGDTYSSWTQPDVTPMGNYRNHDLAVKWDCCCYTIPPSGIPSFLWDDFH